MSDAPASLVLERIARLGQSVADLMESQAKQGRQLHRTLDAVLTRLDGIEIRISRMEQALHGSASEQVLPGNRVEKAFSRALRTNIRMDEMQDRWQAEQGPR